MAYVDKINVQGTDYDIQDKRLPESDGTVVLNKNFQANGISGSEIIERMNHEEYAFVKDDTEQPWTGIYAGVCKNGNKLTFVVFGTFTYNENGNNDASLGQFYIPYTVGNKLYPFTGQLLDIKRVILATGYDTTKAVSVSVVKNSGTSVRFDFRKLNDEGLTDGETYTFRIEETFLLSDNLAA